MELTKIRPTTNTEQQCAIQDDESAVITAPSVNKQRSIIDDIRGNKYGKFFTNILFWSRIMVLILTIFLLFLSTSYCIAQLFEAKLDLITECSEPKSREEIWQHSFEATSKYSDDNIINYETMYGYTNTNCMTTKKLEINQYQLWYTNKYERSEMNPINVRCVLFGLIALYCSFIIILSVTNLIIDIIHVYRGTLHQKSRLFAQQTRNNYEDGHKKCSVCHIFRIFVQQSKKYNESFGQDTTGWIILKFVSEFTEILLQTNALFIYNGYDLFGDDLYQANKPEFIKLFAGIIAFNALTSGLLWLFYAILPVRCHGELFTKLLFFVDKFSDFLYIIFPFIILYHDDYNANTDDFMVLLAQLNIQSALAFFAVYLPLLFICTKCLVITMASEYRIRKIYFEEWQSNQARNLPRATSLSDQIKLPSKSIIKREETADDGSPTASSSKGETNILVAGIQQSNASQIIRQTPPVISSPRKHEQNWILKSGTKRSILKRICIISLSLILLGYGIFIVSYMIQYMDEAYDLCRSVQEQHYLIDNGFHTKSMTMDQIDLLQDHPELFLWDKCLYKVYPFTKNDNQVPCQCRVFVVEDWSQLASAYEDRLDYLNITQQEIVNGALKHWHLLEKFKSHQNEAPVHIKYSLASEIFTSPFMKAFEWSYARLSTIGDGISYWQELEYIKLDNTLLLDTLPSDIGQLHNMKSLVLIDVGIDAFPDTVCDMLNLEILEITRAVKIESIPKCITQLKELQIIAIDTSSIIDIPLEIFNLPRLVEFSIYDSFVSWDGLLAYNLPTSINKTNASALHSWFDTDFEFNSDAVFWLQLNPICDLVNSNDTTLPNNFREFLDSENVKCQEVCRGDWNFARYCVPRIWSDGKCDVWCNHASCDFDGGDCVQLCFDNPLSNCSYDLFTNDQCDQQCDNEFCTGYRWGSDFKASYTEGYYSNYAADNTQCSADNSTLSQLDYLDCKESITNNSYFQPISQSKISQLQSIRIYVDESSWQCEDYMIGDGLCDDICRTDECSNDGGDCDEICVDDYCSVIYTVWTIVAPIDDMIVANHSTVCRQMLPELTTFADFEILESLPDEFNLFTNTLLCENIFMPTVDLNDDGYINFKEFVTIIFAMGSAADISSAFNRGIGLNCSACIGDSYDIDMTQL